MSKVDTRSSCLRQKDRKIIGICSEVTSQQNHKTLQNFANIVTQSISESKVCIKKSPKTKNTQTLYFVRTAASLLFLPHHLDTIFCVSPVRQCVQCPVVSAVSAPSARSWAPDRNSARARGQAKGQVYPKRAQQWLHVHSREQSVVFFLRKSCLSKTGQK